MRVGFLLGAVIWFGCGASRGDKPESPSGPSSDDVDAPCPAIHMPPARAPAGSDAQPADTGSGAQHSLAAESAHSEAVEAARMRRWGDAIAAIDRALDAEPSWTELYFERAGMHAGEAGQSSDMLSLSRPRFGIPYKHITCELAAAAADWEAFLKAAPDDPRRADILKLIGQARSKGDLALEYARVLHQTKGSVEDHASACEAIGQIAIPCRPKFVTTSYIADGYVCVSRIDRIDLNQACGAKGRSVIFRFPDWTPDLVECADAWERTGYSWAYEMLVGGRSTADGCSYEEGDHFCCDH